MLNCNVYNYRAYLNNKQIKKYSSKKLFALFQREGNEKCSQLSSNSFYIPGYGEIKTGKIGAVGELIYAELKKSENGRYYIQATYKDSSIRVANLTQVDSEEVSVSFESRSQSGDDTKELIKMYEEENSILTEELKAVKNELSARKNELRLSEIKNNNLTASLCAADKKQCAAEVNLKCAETEFYEGEARDTVLKVLNEYIAHMNIDSMGARHYHLLKDIIENNRFGNKSREFAEEIKNCIARFERMSSKERSKFTSLGFTIEEDGPHYKLKLNGDDRYLITLAKTASDKRSSINCAMEAQKKLAWCGVRS